MFEAGFGILRLNIQSHDSISTFEQNLICIFLSVRVNLTSTFQFETPCIVGRKIERQRSIQNIVVGDRSGGGARILRNTIQSVTQNKKFDSYQK